MEDSLRAFGTAAHRQHIMDHMLEVSVLIALMEEKSSRLLDEPLSSKHPVVIGNQANGGNSLYIHSVPKFLTNQKLPRQFIENTAEQLDEDYISCNTS
jgi:hypothetical protein